MEVTMDEQQIKLLQETVTITKFEYISLLCHKRDTLLTHYVKTFHPKWKDKTITDIDKFREDSKRIIMEAEERRAILIGQEPQKFEDMFNQLFNAFNNPKWQQIYNGGLPIG